MRSKRLFFWMRWLTEVALNVLSKLHIWYLLPQSDIMQINVIWFLVNIYLSPLIIIILLSVFYCYYVIIFIVVVIQFNRICSAVIRGVYRIAHMLCTDFFISYRFPRFPLSIYILSKIFQWIGTFQLIFFVKIGSFLLWYKWSVSVSPSLKLTTFFLHIIM